MTGIVNFLLLALPQRAQVPAQAALCRLASKCLTGLLPNPPLTNPTAAQCLVAMITITLNQAAECFTAERKGDDAAVDRHWRALQHGFKTARNEPLPDPFSRWKASGNQPLDASGQPEESQQKEPE